MYPIWHTPKVCFRPTSILEIYVNDLPDQINFICKIFAEDTSLFSPVYDKKISSQNELDIYIQKINDRAFQWKVSFNTHPNKQAQELYFSRKIQKDDFKNFLFNWCNVSSSYSHKRLLVYLKDYEQLFSIMRYKLFTNLSLGHT